MMPSAAVVLPLPGAPRKAALSRALQVAGALWSPARPAGRWSLPTIMFSDRKAWKWGVAEAFLSVTEGLTLPADIRFQSRRCWCGR